jgi:hypothetical protein
LESVTRLNAVHNMRMSTLIEECSRPLSLVSATGFENNNPADFAGQLTRQLTKRMPATLPRTSGVMAHQVAITIEDVEEDDDCQQESTRSNEC